MEPIETKVSYLIKTKVADRKRVGEEPYVQLMMRFEGSWEFVYLGNDCPYQIGDPIEIRITHGQPSKPPVE